MKWMRWVLVVLVVVIVVLAYMAFVGTTEAASDVNDPADDPTDGDRDPTAYGIIDVSIRINNGVSRYYSDDPEVFLVNVYNYVSFDEGRVYQNQKWDSLGIWSDDVEVWVKVDIKGPGQFSDSWTSDKKAINIDEWGWETVDFQSGRCFFWDTGSYTATLTAMVDGPEYSGEMVDASSTITFTVNL